MNITRNGHICLSKADTSSFRSYGANSFGIENLDKSGQKFLSNDSLQPESTKVAEHSVDKKILAIREYFYSVIFEISDKQMQFAELKNTPKQNKQTDTLITLINQSQEIRPQGLDLGRSTASNQAIANLRPQPRF